MRTERGFLAAGLVNILGILVFSRGLTSQALAAPFPELFSLWGQLAVLLWGAAYLSMRTSYRKCPGIVAVFALEKALYVVAWVWWLLVRGGTLQAVWNQDWLAGTFYACFGVIDLAFCAFFLRAFLSASQPEGD